MTEGVVLAASGLLVILALGVELRRGRVPGVIDLLRAATIVYVVCFALLPASLVLFDWRGFESSAWNWIFARPFRDPAYAEASVLALAGYLAMVAGHGAVARGAPPVAAPRVVSAGRLWVAGLGLGAAGLAALIGYTMSIGGFGPLLLEAAAFRGPAPPVESSLAFLKNVAPLVLGASVAFYALRARSRGRACRLATVGFLVSAAFGLVVLFHQAGRAILAGFLVAYPLAAVIRRGRIAASLLAAGAAATVILFLAGKSSFQVLRDPGQLAHRAGQLVDQPTAAVGDMALEFAFPVVTLAHAVEAVPREAPFRWFADLPLALAYLAPKRLLALELPATVSMVNSAQFSSFGAVPVDLLSFGYYSAGPPGLVVVALLFGALLALVERWLPAGPDPLRAVLRAFWLILLAQRVMYGDPQLLWVPGFWLLLTTALLLVRPPTLEAVRASLRSRWQLPWGGARFVAGSEER